MSGFCQSSWTDNTSLMATSHVGYVLPEYSFFNYVAEDYVHSVDLCLLRETTGKTPWEQLYHYPEYGVSLFFSTLGNNKVFGHELALTYFFRVNIATWNRLRLYQRIGIGLGYVNKKYHVNDNYLNVATGSHLNIHFNMRFGLDYKLTDRLNLNTGLSFDHFSNANTVKPNLGINYVTGFTGLSYRLGASTERQFHEPEKHERKNIAYLVTSIGGKQTHAGNKDYFWTGSLSLECHRTFWRAFHLGAGADLFFDSSTKLQMLKFDLTYKNSYPFQSGIHISQTLLYNHFSVTIQEGIYLGLTEHVDNNVMYNRGIIRYQWNDRFNIRLAMKSHAYILDYPELGFGIKL
ncbi:MAG: acyloxyacyl hydrolase [Flavobacteriales bacterium]|nr:acyloxyacyl hydrolase [Flavobacteriales bacterium]